MRRWIVGCWLICAVAASAEEPDWQSLAAKLQSIDPAGVEHTRQQLLDGGMAAHAALTEGPDATAAVRADLRRQIRSKRDAAERAKGLIVHEWGAISYQQGLDDAKIDGREDTSDLPEFAQVWSKLAKRPLPEGAGGGIRIEVVRKPIVYFYSDKFETMTFTVACPRGMFTQWSPRASKVVPEPTDGVDPKSLLGAQAAMLTWRNFDLQPGAKGPLPPVPDAAWWWPICRDTDATPINVDGQVEKFLFYRGLLADCPSAVAVEGGSNRRYTLTSSLKKETLRHVIMVNVDKGKATAKYISALAPGAPLTVELMAAADGKDVKVFAEEQRQRLAELLEEEGLFPKESAGMTRIWRKDWLETDGVRLIYFSPPGATAALLPISIEPRPAGVVRTLLVSVECLRDSKENVIKELVGQLGSATYSVREGATRQLIQLGKQAEPALRSAYKASEDQEVRNRITVILQKIDPRAKAEAEAAKDPNAPEPAPDTPEGGR
jgi:hypothetical protein